MITRKIEKKYSNDEITVIWVPSKCIHATTCFRELLEVFNPRNRPWVNMKGASTKRIIEVVDKCPTQALSWKYNKDMIRPEAGKEAAGSEEVTPEDVYRTKKDIYQEKAEISLLPDGPILVKGKFTIIGEEGNEYKSMHMTSFCRCGYSGSQPFCDGTHRKTGFKG